MDFNKVISKLKQEKDDLAELTQAVIDTQSAEISTLKSQMAHVLSVLEG